MCCGVLGPLTPRTSSRAAVRRARRGRWMARLVEPRPPGDRTQLAEAESRWVVVEDAGRLRDALGVSLPLGVPEALLGPVADPLGDLLARYARSHAVFTAGGGRRMAGVWVRRGPGHAAPPGRRRAAGRGRPASGRLDLARNCADGPWPDEGPPTPRPPARSRAGPRPARPSSATPGCCGCCAAGRWPACARPSSRSATTDFARFLPAWQGVGELRGVDGVLRAVEQLAGVPLPASALESLILPARVRDYRPGMLDELTAAGRGALAGARLRCAGPDGWVSLHPAELAAAHPRASRNR